MPLISHRSVNIDHALATRLRRELEGEVLFDAFSRGRYSTDASIYQIDPIGVVIPRHEQDVVSTIQIAADAGVPILPRGAGTSQCGQTVGHALVIDNSKYLDQIVAFDPQAKTICVQPGIVLDQLNAFLKPHGLFYPIDVSTASQATIGGMSGNNSCGSRSIRYGNMVHNVRALAEREQAEIARRFPKLLRRVGGYNLDSVSPGGHNMARLLVGSEGTLAYFRQIHLALQPIPPHKVLGVCHFASLYKAMDTTQHLVTLDPTAVELVDSTMIELAREIPLFRTTVDRFLKGEPEALLLLEFAGEDKTAQLRKLKQLVELMADLGFPGSVVEVADNSLQRDVWEVRKAGLNIMMSMKGDGKPVSFIEDCAVPLKDLAEYTDRLTRVFDKHGTRGTMYAHASVGCLHVRPILNMKQDGAQKMR